MCTHDLCFEQKYENSKKKSTENCHFYSHEKPLYVAWVCFRNETYSSIEDSGDCRHLDKALHQKSYI